jgi:taurine dioxygenase
MNAASQVTIRKLTASVGAVIGGVDMRASVPEDAVALVRRTLTDNGVIFFPAQDVTIEQFWDFMRLFGQPLKEEATGTDADVAQDVRAADLSPSRHATAVWHADTTSLAAPPWGSALRAVTVPAVGGDTCWSSMYAAWDALSQPMQRMLDGLTAVHSVQPTVERMKDYAQFYEPVYRSLHAAEQIHPVVLTHPENGRKALYVNESFTTRIVELEPPESAALLAMLFRHVEQPDFTVRWKWTPGDVAFWDNRAVQHYAVPDYQTTRVMQRIVLKGVQPGEAARPPMPAAIAAGVV